jgi:hypothetical protein
MARVSEYRLSDGIHIVSLYDTYILARSDHW